MEDFIMEQLGSLCFNNNIGKELMRMDKSINILDQDYSLWIQDLSKRYRRSQVKAAVKVNTEMLKF